MGKFEKWAKQHHTVDGAIKETETRVKNYEQGIEIEKERLKRLKNTNSEETN